MISVALVLIEWLQAMGLLAVTIALAFLVLMIGQKIGIFPDTEKP